MLWSSKLISAFRTWAWFSLSKEILWFKRSLGIKAIVNSSKLYDLVGFWARILSTFSNNSTLTSRYFFWHLHINCLSRVTYTAKLNAVSLKIRIILSVRFVVPTLYLCYYCIDSINIALEEVSCGICLFWSSVVVRLYNRHLYRMYPLVLHPAIILLKVGSPALVGLSFPN